MGFDFSKLNSPEAIERRRLRKEAEERAEALRKKTVCVVGVGPKYLGGEAFLNDSMVKLNAVLGEILIEAIKEDGIERVMTVGTAGASQMGFFTVMDLKDRGYKLENIIVLPYEGHVAEYHASLYADNYDRLLGFADCVIIADYEEGYRSEDTLAEKLQARDRYLANHCSHVICVRPVVGLKFPPNYHILKNSRGAGMRCTDVYTDHNLTYDSRWQI